jgi:hypothetical protein
MLQAHARVEIGLDAHFFCAEPSLSTIRLKHAFSASRIDFVSRALQLVYGMAFDRSRLCRARRNVTRFFNAYLKLAGLIGVELGRPGAVRSILRMDHVRSIASLLIDRSSAAWGFLNPVPAGDALVNAVDGAIVDFHDEFETDVATGVREVPDYDLETGRIRLPRVLSSPATSSVWITGGSFATLPGAAA